MMYTGKGHPQGLWLNTDFQSGFQREDMLPAVGILCTDGRLVPHYMFTVSETININFTKRRTQMDHPGTSQT